MPPETPEMNTSEQSESLLDLESADTGLPEDLRSDETPQYSIEELSNQSIESVDTSLPESDGFHTHLVFSGPSTDRITRPTRTGAVTPDQIIVLTTEENPDTDVQARFENEINGPVEFYRLNTPMTMMELCVEAYRILDSHLDHERKDDVQLSINLSAESSFLELIFFNTVSAYVLEYPSHRSSVDLYYAPIQESDIRSITEIQAPADKQSTGSEDHSRTGSQMLFEYVQMDLSKRYDRLQTIWNEIIESTDPQPDVRERVSSVLMQLENTITQIEAQEQPQIVHKLEDTIWLLADYADTLSEGDLNDTLLVDRFNRQIDRFEDSISDLRNVIRQNRRTFAQEEGNSPQSSLIKQFTDSDLIKPENADDSDVYQLPIPPAQKSWTDQKNTIQRELMQLLYDVGRVDSISELSRQLADRMNKSSDESFRSKVQYNARILAEKGYLKREQHGRSYRVYLSIMGKVWMQAHQ